MFYALAAHKIDTRGYEFEHTLQDIETLNQRAMRGELHLSAISFGAYAYVLDKYCLLPNGASMGDGYGPMVIADANAATSRRRCATATRRPSSMAQTRKSPSPA